jgi:hypothetical protein
MTWHCSVLCWGVPPLAFWLAVKAYGRRRASVPVPRGAPELQPIQQVPRRTRRQLAQGVGREGPHDQNRNSRETILKEQAEREKREHGV